MDSGSVRRVADAVDVRPRPGASGARAVLKRADVLLDGVELEPLLMRLEHELGQRSVGGRIVSGSGMSSPTR